MRLRKARDGDEELILALEQINEEANRAAEIVHRVRRFVQKRESCFCDLSINRMVEEVTSFSRSELEQRHVQLVLELSEDLPPVSGDSVQIQQVIMNLLRNGLEAMQNTPEQGRRMIITTLRHGDDTVQVGVSDCGEGIPIAYSDKVFRTPFFTTKPEGLGMGLAISRSIVQSHGGRLWLSGNPERAAVRSISLYPPPDEVK